MHMADVALGNLGANGIVAGGMDSAVGAALSAHLLEVISKTVKRSHLSIEVTTAWT